MVAHAYAASAIAAVAKAILKADLVLNPSNDGKLMRIPMPPRTEERRKEIVKKVNDSAEASRNVVRQCRRDGNEALKEREREKEIGKDDEHRGHEEMLKPYDHYIAETNQSLELKDKDILAG